MINTNKMINGNTAAAPEFQQLYNVQCFLIFIWSQFGKKKNKKQGLKLRGGSLFFLV